MIHQKILDKTSDMQQLIDCLELVIAELDGSDGEYNANARDLLSKVNIKIFDALFIHRPTQYTIKGDN